MRTMARKEERLLKAISQVLDQSKGVGFNDLFRELRRQKELGSRATLAKYLRILVQSGKIRRRMIREKPPRLVEYSRIDEPGKPDEHTFQKLAEDVRTSETVKVTLTDVQTGRRRVLILGRDNNWIPIQDERS